MGNPIVKVENFSKLFGRRQVVSDLSFEVKEGEIFAFLGANGSGKTTTIRCLLNLLQSDNGNLLINNKPYSPRMSSEVGYLPEERGLYTQVKVLDAMVYFGEIKGLTSQQAKNWSMDYLQKVGLADKTKEKIKKLSSGQQQKIQLGITIINQPRLLILDEPTKGLDPVNRSLLMDILLEMKEKGSTIMFITHQMEEVEKIADRLIMIKDGVRKLYGEVGEVKSQFGKNTIHLEYRGQLPKNDELYRAVINKNYTEITPQNKVTTKQVLEYLLKHEVQINKFEITAPSLNEIFILVSKNHE